MFNYQLVASGNYRKYCAGHRNLHDFVIDEKKMGMLANWSPALVIRGEIFESDLRTYICSTGNGFGQRRKSFFNTCVTIYKNLSPVLSCYFS
jgi:hypothetical protein